MPQMYNDATLAIRYNRITGAHLSHLDIAALGVFEYDEMIALVNHFEGSTEPIEGSDNAAQGI